MNDLQNLTSIGDSLKITYNANLTSLEGLSNVVTIGEEIRITNNFSLSCCSIDAVCDQIANGAAITISDNATYCLDLPTVTSACDGTLDLVLNTQTEVDNFSDCVTIVNNLTIESTDPSDPIVDLSNLSSITEIGGNLEIRYNNNLTEISEFNSLTSVGGFVNINNNEALVTINGFDVLESVDGYFSIYQHLSLTTVSSFSMLASVGQAMGFQSNWSLLTLPDFENLSSIGQYDNGLEVFGLVIENSPLEEFSGFENLINIDGNLSILNNSNLTSIPEFNNLQEVLGFEFAYNSELINILGFNNLTSDVTDLKLIQNINLENIEGLSNITTILEDLEVTECDKISNLDQLNNLVSIGGSIQLKNNIILDNIDGLVNVPSVTDFIIISGNSMLNCCHIDVVCEQISTGGTITIENNDTGCLDIPTVTASCEGTTDYIFNSQTEVDNFSDCVTIVNNLTIESTDAGDPIVDLSNLSSIEEINGYFSIWDNDQLEVIDVFNALTYIGGDFTIQYNSILSTISNFDELEEIVGKFSVIQNDILTEITGFSSLTKVATGPGTIGIQIALNYEMENIPDFNSLTEISGGLSITQNPKLASINGFNGINNIESIGINLNNELASIAGFLNLEICNGYFEITDNPSLNSFPTFSNLTALGNSTSTTRISNNGLISISGFNNLTSINHDFEIVSNIGLTTINGFTSLEEVTGDLDIRLNTLLSDIIGFENIAVISGELTIEDNPELDLCHISSVCSHIAAGGITTISGNDTNCADVPTVQGLCEDENPIIDGTEDACITVASLTIDAGAGNNNEWIDIFNSSGNILCSINANGNDLGLTEFSIYQSSADRMANIPYMNRDIMISPASQPTTPVSVRMYYTADELAGLMAADASISDEGDLDFTKTTTDCDGQFEAPGEFVTQTDSGPYGTMGDIFVEGEVSSFSTFYAHGQDVVLSSVVPVEWVDFTVREKNNEVELLWSTASEINSSHFEIEHSIDGADFYMIGREEGNGNRVEISNYDYVHEYPVIGTNYYRLKQVDYDGNFDYSDTRIARFTGTTSLSIFPNPVKEFVMIQSDRSEDLTYRLYNQIGEEIITGVCKGGDPISTQDLKVGTYVLVVQNSIETKTFSVIKI